MIKEDIKKLEQIIYTINTFNNIVDQEYKDTAVFTLAQIISTAQVLNKNEVYAKDISAEDINLFEKNLDTIYNNLWMYLQSLAISSDVAPLFWVKIFINYMLIHNNVINWQKKLFISLLSNAILDLDKKSNNRFINIQIIQDIYVLLNNIGISFEELYSDDKAKQFLDILNNHQIKCLESLQDWELNNASTPATIDDAKYTSNIFENVEKFLTVSDFLTKSNNESLKSKNNCEHNKGNVNLNENLIFSNDSVDDNSNLEKEGLNLSYLNSNIKNTNEDLKLTNESADSKIETDTGFNLESENLTLHNSNDEITDSDKRDLDVSYKTNLEKYNVISEQSKKEKDNKKSITPSYQIQKNHAFGNKKSNKASKSDYKEVIISLKMIASRIENKATLVLLDKEINVLIKVIELDTFNFCNVLLEVPNVSEIYNSLNDDRSDLLNIKNDFNNKLNSEIVANRLDKLFYNCLEKLVHLGVDVPEFYYNYISRNGDILLILYIKYCSSISEKIMCDLLKNLSLDTIKAVDTYTILTVNQYISSFFLDLTDHNLFSINYFNSDLYRYCNAINRVSRDIVWKKMFIEKSSFMGEKSNENFMAFVGQIKKLNDIEKNNELTRCVIHIFLHYPNNVDKYVNLFVSELKKQEVVFDENIINYKRPDEIEEEVINFLNTQQTIINNFLDNADSSQLSLIITKKTISHASLLHGNTLFANLINYQSKQSGTIIKSLNNNIEFIDEEIINRINLKYKLYEINHKNQTSFYCKPEIFPEPCSIQTYFKNIPSLSSEIINKINTNIIFQTINGELNLLDIFASEGKLHIFDSHKKFIDELKFRFSSRTLFEQKDLLRSLFIMTAFPDNKQFIDKHEIFESIIDWRIVNFCIPANFELTLFGNQNITFDIESNILKNMYINHFDKLTKFIKDIAKHLTHNSLSVKIEVMQNEDSKMIELEKSIKLNHPDIFKVINEVKYSASKTTKVSARNKIT